MEDVKQEKQPSKRCHGAGTGAGSGNRCGRARGVGAQVRVGHGKSVELSSANDSADLQDRIRVRGYPRKHSTAKQVSATAAVQGGPDNSA